MDYSSGFNTLQSNNERIGPVKTQLCQENPNIHKISNCSNPSDYLKIRERFFSEFKEMENKFENSKNRSIERLSMLEKSKIDEEKAWAIQKEREERERLKAYYNELNKKLDKEDVKDALDKQVREKQIMIEDALNEDAEIRERLILWDKLAKMNEDEIKVRNRTNQRNLFEKLQNQIKERNSDGFL